MKNFIYGLLLLISGQTIGQSTIKITDSETKAGIPYANITIGESENGVSNAEGYFSVSEINMQDNSLIKVTYLGYVSRTATVAEVKAQNNVIAMTPAVFEVENVNVVKPDPNAIMAEVRKNLNANYKTQSEPMKNTVFLRESQAYKPSTVEFEITESPGYTKHALKNANKELSIYVTRFKNNPPREYTDLMGNYYTSLAKKDEKTVVFPKLEVLKATRLRDDQRAISATDLEQGLGKILLKHLDSTKYYRVKSGWFGSHDTVSIRKDYMKKKISGKAPQLQQSKYQLQDFMSKNNFIQSKEMDFVCTPDNYIYTYAGTIFNNNNDLVYVITFQPDSRKAKYNGKLYVSEKDFAVIRTDYELAEGKTMESFNLKLILGVKSVKDYCKGSILYKQNPGATGYYLQYAARETGQYIYINRPVKFIEITDKKDEDVVAFDLKLEGNIRNKSEFLNMSKSEVSTIDFDSIKENDFAFLKIKKYDPAIWKGVSAIEPLEEMKQYSVSE